MAAWTPQRNEDSRNQQEYQRQTRSYMCDMAFRVSFISAMILDLMQGVWDQHLSTILNHLIHRLKHLLLHFSSSVCAVLPFPVCGEPSCTKAVADSNAKMPVAVI